VSESLSNEERVAAFGRDLAEHVLEALPDWIVAIVNERFGAEISDCNTLEEVAKQVVVDLRTPLLAFFALDIDEQHTTPLTIIRTAMMSVTAFLQTQGVAPVSRDPFDERAMPADVYALGPLAWNDLGEAAHTSGLQWGAAKAFVHRARHLPSA
jgi:hypothetical protein